MKHKIPSFQRNISIVFFLFAIFYFIPISVPFKIAIPLLILSLAGIRLLPALLTSGFFFSFMGDVAGAAHSFVFQMLFFAIAHIIMSISFLKEIGQFNLKRNIIPSLIVLAILGSALFFIVPCVQNPYLAGGVIFYALVISMMLFSATALLLSDPIIKYRGTVTDTYNVQHFNFKKSKSLIFSGAVLFVISDYILAWNKFVEPVVMERYLIMVPYYLGQFLIFTGAANYFRNIKARQNK